MPGASALAEARERLGPEPLELLFATAARRLATRATRGAWYRHWRVMVVDGTCLDVPDSPANQALGRAKSGRGEGVGAFPQVRVVGLVEAGTHAIVDAAQGPYASGEQTLARQLAREGGRLGPGVLLLADRLFVGAQLWRAMAGTGAELVWRTKCGSKTAPKLPVDQVLSDGSWLSRLYAASDRRKRHPITVRVIEYTLSDPGRRTSTDRYRLVTTICDPDLAPAGEPAALYTERWEVETALGELKTTQRGPKQVLRSKRPELVAQEVWAHLLVHYALRQVMHTAALEADLDPDRLSFIRSLRVIRRQVIARPVRVHLHMSFGVRTDQPAATLCGVVLMARGGLQLYLGAQSWPAKNCASLPCGDLMDLNQSKSPGPASRGESRVHQISSPPRSGSLSSLSTSLLGWACRSTGTSLS